MRKVAVALFMVLGMALLPAADAAAQILPWISVSPPFARPGDYVVFNVVGMPGHTVDLAYSMSSAGAGPGVLLGGDYQVLASGVIGPSGAFSYPLQIPVGLDTEVYFQAGVTPPGGSMVLTNSASLFITPDRGGNLVVPEFVFEKVYACNGPTPNVLHGLEFRVYVSGTKVIREATLTGPAGFMGYPTPPPLKMLGYSMDEGPSTLSKSGYPYFFGWEYQENNLWPPASPNLGWFPDGTYTINVIFGDGTTGSTSVILGGGFPAVPSFTSPTCGQANLGRNPTISWTGTTAGQFEVGLGPIFGGDSDDTWSYTGTANSVTVPGNYLWLGGYDNPSSQAYGVWIDNYGPKTPSGARKGNLNSGYFFTGPSYMFP